MHAPCLPVKAVASHVPAARRPLAGLEAERLRRETRLDRAARRFRVPLHAASLLEVAGPLQRVDGVIHVRGHTRVDERLVRTLHHEYTHAALHDAAAGLFPAWLNEGLAEFFEALAVGKRHLSPGEHAALAGARRSGIH